VLKICVTVALLAAYGVLAYVYRDRVGSTLTHLPPLTWWWIVLAVLAESGSMFALARSQWYLLRIGESRPTLMSALALVYAGNALSTMVPVVGGAASTAYSFRQWKLRGLEDATIGWAVTVSGAMSTLAFALIATVGALLTSSSAATVLGLAAAAAGAIPALAILLAVYSARARRVFDRVMSWAVRVSRRLLRHPGPEAMAKLDRGLDRAAALHAPRKAYVLASLMALRNWTADWLCLAIAIRATGSPVPWRGLLLVYCLAKTVNSFNLTPGGIGVVDVALVGGLVAAGVPATHAVPAVVVYRAISLGLVVALGLAVGAVVSAHGRTGERWGQGRRR
jgi:uncharacterized protein (TIRG00374 family)